MEPGAEAEATIRGSGDLPFNTLPFARIAHIAGQTWHLQALSTGEPCPSLPTITTSDRLDNGLLRAEFASGDLVRLAGLLIAGAQLTLAEDHPANFGA